MTEVGPDREREAPFTLDRAGEGGEAGSWVGGWLTRMAGFAYSIGARIHRSFMGWTAPRRGRLACAVVSVGAMTVGGAGKTPVAARIALGLHRRGWRVVIASRGYRGSQREAVTLVSDGRRVRSRVESTGDESLLLAAHAPGVPVLVGRDRRVVGHHAVSVFDAQILVLDDGFQHHRLARDLDIVCIDGRAGLGNRRVVPAGRLREPASALVHADWLCVVDALEEGPTDSCVSAHLASGRPVVHAARRPQRLERLGRAASRELGSLSGQRVGIVAGIGQPDSLRRTLEALGAQVVDARIFRDHHLYRREDVAGLDSEIDSWITTEKDALKILPEWPEPVALWVLAIEAEFEDEGLVLEEIETTLLATSRLKSASADSASAVEASAR